MTIRLSSGKRGSIGARLEETASAARYAQQAEAAAAAVSGKQDLITASGILKGDGSGGVSAAEAGTDYGTYSKPAGGIPKTDLAEAVQESLDKADAACSSGTVSGPVASFTGDAAGLPLKAVLVTIAPVQSGSGDPSPTNVRAISGWTGCTLSHSGEDTGDPDTVSISWQSEAGTVYGGTLNVTSGLLTSLFWLTEMGQYTWTKGASEGRTYFQITKNSILISEGASKNPRRSSDMSALCSCFPSSIITGTTNNIRIYAEGYSTVDAFDTAVTGQYLCYELETPITCQLTPHELTALLGENKVWADCGDVSVTYGAYLAAVKEYADRADERILASVARKETGCTATKNYSAGENLYIGATLYRVTANIANGGTITPGTNAVQTTVMGETRPRMTVLSIAANEWVNGSVTKTVTGMTESALAWVEFSDAETVYGIAQAANALTFTASAAPSEGVTVKVGWFV